MLNSLLWSNKIKLQTKLTIYTTIVDPILTYGCEWWQLSYKEKKMIETVEMDFLRRACNISRMQQVRNEDIRRKTGYVFTTAGRIESRQLLWYGHEQYEDGGEAMAKESIDLHLSLIHI